MTGRCHARVVTLLLLAAFAFLGTAHASHYRLAGSGLLSKHEVKALKHAGLTSTKALLEAGLRRADRAKLARQTSIKRARIDSLVQQCDILRIAGVGPTVVRLLQDAGFRHTQDLRRATAGTVWKKLSESNSRLRLVPEAPSKTLVATWLSAAKALPRILKGMK